ncbi:MAG: hypothetical protein IT497_09660 [Ottowia sp.]|nr:hypothetical protein [Ottowia sp.]
MMISRHLSTALQKEILLAHAAIERAQCCQYLDKACNQKIDSKTAVTITWLAKNTLLGWKWLKLFREQRSNPNPKTNSKNILLNLLKAIGTVGYFAWQLKR